MSEPKFSPTTITHTDRVVFTVSAVIAAAFLAWGVIGTASLGSVSSAVSAGSSATPAGRS